MYAVRSATGTFFTDRCWQLAENCQFFPVSSHEILLFTFTFIFIFIYISFFYNFLIIQNDNHLVTDETDDDRDGSDSVSEGRPVRDFE